MGGAVNVAVDAAGRIAQAEPNYWVDLRGATTFQSSTNPEWGGDASLAIDNNTNSDFRSGSCTHTAFDHVPWWAVNFGPAGHYVDGVEVYSRGDAPSLLEKGFDVYVDDTKCASVAGIGQGKAETVRCFEPTYGTSISIEIPAEEVEAGAAASGGSYLILCEVKIRATSPQAVAQ